MFASSALLVIDLQPIFTDSIKDPDYEGRVQRTLAFMRQQLPATHIVHIRANYVDTPMKTRSGDLNPTRAVPSDSIGTSWAVEIPGEPVVTKSTINGFHKTELEEYLKSLGVSRLYCIGMLTAACVHSTAVGGMNRGFECVLIEEACIDKTPERQAQVFSLFKDYLYQTITIEALMGNASTRRS